MAAGRWEDLSTDVCPPVHLSTCPPACGTCVPPALMVVGAWLGPRQIPFGTEESKVRGQANTLFPTSTCDLPAWGSEAPSEAKETMGQENSILSSASRAPKSFAKIARLTAQFSHL